MARNLVAASSQYLKSTSPAFTGYAFTFAGFYWSNASQTGVIAAISDGTANNKFEILEASGTLFGRCFAGGVQATNTAAGPIVHGRWQHVVFRGSSATSRHLLLNGSIRSNSGANSTPTGLSETTLGQSAGATFFDGRLAHWAVWDTPLTDAECVLLTQGTLPSAIQPTHLTNYWPLDGTTSPEPDLGTSPKPLTVTGATATGSPTLTFSVTVNGTDRTTFTSRYETTIDQNGSATPDTATIMVRGFTPTVGMAVIIAQAGFTFFEGQITELELVQRRNGTRKRYRCTCTDWTVLLDRRLVTQAWTSIAIETIVANVISGFTTGFTIQNVATGFAAITFSAFMEPVSSVLQRLAEAAGASFKVRYDKDIYFATTSTLIVPATLDGTTKTYKRLVYRQSMGQIRPRVIVTGAGTTTAVAAAVSAATIVVTDRSYLGASGTVGADAQVLTYTGQTISSTAASKTTPPAPVFTLGGGGAAVTQGTYKFGWTYTDGSGVESSLSAVQTISTVGNANPTVSGTAPTMPSGATVRLYISNVNTTTYFLAVSGIYAMGATVLTSIQNDGATSPPGTSNYLAGSTFINVADTSVFNGRKATSGSNVFTYSGKSVASGAGTLTGIPASGTGSITSTITVGDTITDSAGAILTGVTGVLYAIPEGAQLNILVTRNDATAQTTLAALEGGDGIHEFFVSKSDLLSVSACNTYGDAELNLGKNVQESATFTSEDASCTPGASAVIDGALLFGVTSTLPIAHVSISWIPGRSRPQLAVTATSQYKTLSQYLADLQSVTA